jgi:LacI family transcriptional regulator
VTIDNEEATYNATSHLVKNNFKNIGFITTDSGQMQMRDRRHGYEKAVLEYKLKPQILKTPYNETRDGKSKEFISNFLKKLKNLDALFFSTNYLTQTGLEALKEKSAHLIQDIGIITFDDIKLFKIYTPSITAVSLLLRAISNALMNLLLLMLKHEYVKESTENILLKAELIIRESSVSKK